MNPAELIKAVVALLFVLALILFIAHLVRRFGLDRNWQLKGNNDTRRLCVLERLTIDPKRQLVLIRRDKHEHLLLLGQNEASVVESYEPEKTQ